MKSNPLDNNIDVDIWVIESSILCAILHFIAEAMFIRIESKACETSTIDYTVTCFNGRFGWVPFTNIFNSAKLSQESC